MYTEEGTRKKEEKTNKVNEPLMRRWAEFGAVSETWHALTVDFMHRVSLNISGCVLSCLIKIKSLIFLRFSFICLFSPLP